jgi:peptidyl-prolyl cis-trans isomerase B (cyclophilin B)
MRRRPLPAVPSVAVLSVVALALAGCGSGEATYPVSTSGEAVVTLECEEPPAPPAEVASFSQEDLPEPLPAEPATLTATLETSCGDIVVELDAAAAPQTVASFQFLAEEGYWDASPCHRLTTSGIYVLQCGDPTGTGQGSPGYGYGIENAPPEGLYPPGTLAMARTMDPESNGGQFFLVYDDTQLPTDGGGYSVFGQVTEGLEIVEQIAGLGVEGGGGDGAPAQPISILSVEVEC